MSRIYNVVAQVGAEKREFLIEAGTKAGAARFAASQFLTAEVAGPEALVRLTKAGVEVLKAVEPEAAPAE